MIPRTYKPLNVFLLLKRQLNITMASPSGKAPKPILILVIAVGVPRDILNWLEADTGFVRYLMLISRNIIAPQSNKTRQNQMPAFEILSMNLF
jgi:hypothetical protein